MLTVAKQSPISSNAELIEQSLNKSSAVANMGDRGQNSHGPKRGGGVVSLSGVELGLPV